MLGCVFGGGYQDGIIEVVRSIGDPLRVKDGLHRSGELLEEGGAGVNPEGDASLVEVEPGELESQVVLIVSVYPEEPEGVLDVDLG
jgi:hypothetical protein